MPAQTIRELFLREFIKSIIIHTEVKPLPKEILNKNNLIPVKFIPIQSINKKPNQAPIIKQFNNSSMQPSILSTNKINIDDKMPSQKEFPQIPKPLSNIKQQFTKQPQNNPFILKKDFINQNFQEFGLRVIGPLLADTLVSSVECQGPGKQILVNKSGLVQTTNITLSPEEITAIIKEISEKTRIPIVTGIFRAAFENFIITAVLSEFIGTRFLIQKINPLQPLI